MSYEDDDYYERRCEELEEESAALREQVAAIDELGIAGILSYEQPRSTNPERIMRSTTLIRILVKEMRDRGRDFMIATSCNYCTQPEDIGELGPDEMLIRAERTRWVDDIFHGMPALVLDR